MKQTMRQWSGVMLLGLAVSSVALSSGWAVAADASRSTAGLQAGRAAFDANACANCHHVSQRGVGPSLKAIAKRYQGEKAEALAGRIRMGSEGRWGATPHPAYEGMDAAEALLMATWIVSGAPR